jgi:hypothetical protein
MLTTCKVQWQPATELEKMSRETQIKFKMLLGKCKRLVVKTWLKNTMYVKAAERFFNLAPGSSSGEAKRIPVRILKYGNGTEPYAYKYWSVR